MTAGDVLGAAMKDEVTADEREALRLRQLRAWAKSQRNRRYYLAHRERILEQQQGYKRARRASA